MRRLLILVSLSLAASCSDTQDDGAVGRLRVRAPVVHVEGGVTCVHLGAVESERVRIAAGTPAIAESVAAAEAAGATCASAGATIEVTGRCEPGQTVVATATLAGAFDADGAPLELAEGSHEPVSDEAACADDEETVVDFDLVILVDAQQGLFNVGVITNAEDPLAFSAACYAIRVTNGDGAVVWARRGICADAYGDGRQAITYDGPCDAESPEHVVDVWAEVLAPDPQTPGSDALVNPCPAGDGDIATWSSGCRASARCVENADVIIDVVLDVTP